MMVVMKCKIWIKNIGLQHNLDILVIVLLLHGHLYIIIGLSVCLASGVA